MIIDTIIRVKQEAERAMKLHKGMNNVHEAYAVILEEVDEFWELVRLNPKKMTPEQYNEYRENLRMELTQIAAMCVRTMEDLNLEPSHTTYGSLECWG